MQLFIPLYIEGGSYIKEEEELWEFVVLWVPPVFFGPSAMSTNENRYEKRKRRTTPVTETYHFVGYSSLYPFYCFPDKVRLRLRYVSLVSWALRYAITPFPANS
jgi:histone acetyltransferase 1